MYFIMWIPYKFTHINIYNMVYMVRCPTTYNSKVLNPPYRRLVTFRYFVTSVYNVNQSKDLN